MASHRMGYLTRVIRGNWMSGGRRKPAPIVHGTNWAYCRGCRCVVCTQAHRLYWREYRHRAKTWPDWAHGRLTTYKQGCRCGRCKVANAAAAAAYRARRRKPKETPLDARHAARLAYYRDRYQQIKAGTWRKA